MYVLLDRDLKCILEALNKYSEIEEVIKHIDSVGKVIYRKNLL